jgi:hypothetical protein
MGKLRKIIEKLKEIVADPAKIRTENFLNKVRR